MVRLNLTQQLDPRKLLMLFPLPEVSQQSLVGWPCVAASPGLVSTQQAQGLLLMLCSGTGTPLCETLSKGNRAFRDHRLQLPGPPSM